MTRVRYSYIMRVDSPYKERLDDRLTDQHLANHVPANRTQVANHFPSEELKIMTDLLIDIWLITFLLSNSLILIGLKIRS